MLTGWRYWWNRYLGWIPFQPCRMCWRWYWGGLPCYWQRRGALLPRPQWWPSYKEYCSHRCYDDAGGGLL
jgi:hypothetical protein